MKYQDFGLANTNDMLHRALSGKYAIGAFNFYNLETLHAILAAARQMHSPIILAVSESALNYMGAETLMGMIHGANIKEHEQIALHLDHGHSFDTCARAIDLGFSSVMIDASHLPFDENAKLSARVAEYAHAHGVSTEAELGQLTGHEDENTKSSTSDFTRPQDVTDFVEQTNVDSLAVAIGTSHGAYKRKSETEELRFDILEKITETLPDFPLVLHGASSIPQNLTTTINRFGGAITGARGIPAAQLRRAVTMNVCKINVDSDLRLAFTAGIREALAAHPEVFNPRDYLVAAMVAIQKTVSDEMINIMASANRV